MRKDIDFNMTAHPLTGDLAVKTDIRAIEQSIRNIVLTSYYERGFNIEFGSNIRASLFENIDRLTARTIRDNIESALDNHEPQAEVIDVLVQASSDDNKLYATIIYNKANNPNEQTMTLTLERIR